MLLSAFALLLATSPALAALHAEQLAIVVNRSMLESVNIGHYYAERRGIPATQVIPLDLGPLRETISRQEYERVIAEPLRQTLEKRGLAPKIRVLVTIYGVPLRVLPPQPSLQELRWREDARGRQHKVWEQLQGLAQRLQVEVEDIASAPTDGQPVDVIKAGMTLIPRLQAAIQSGQTNRTTLSPRELRHLQLQLTGYAMGEPRSLETNTEEKPEVQQRLRVVQAMLQALQQQPSELHRERIYILIQQAFGLQGVLRYAATEWQPSKTESSDASVDSELSVLWWDDTSYRLAGRATNPFHHTLQGRFLAQRPPAATLMVSRLDAPTPALAQQLVDRAMAAEQHGLTGKVYVDARGLQVAQPAALSYAFYDQNLRDMAVLFRQVTSYLVVSENTQERFSQPGQAPEVAVYAGWYTLRSYEDAFTFNTGAMGYHIASGEAVSVHDPREPGWCKNALERGITVTLGPVSEPYLDAFPLPAEFFGLLLTGRYSLVEAYYLTTRYLSWQMVLFGDPLYNPWRTSKYQPQSRLTLYPATQPDAAHLPEAPSSLPFPDPVPERQESLRRQQALLAQYDALLHVLRQGQEEP